MTPIIIMSKPFVDDPLKTQVFERTIGLQNTLWKTLRMIPKGTDWLFYPLDTI